MAEDRDRQPGGDKRPLDKDGYTYYRVVQFIPTTFFYYLPDRLHPVESVEVVQVDLN